MNRQKLELSLTPAGAKSACDEPSQRLNWFDKETCLCRSISERPPPWKRSCDCCTKREPGSNYEIRISIVEPTPYDAAGNGMIFTSVAQLIDTNVLVYRVDTRFPAKQETATNVLEEAVRSGECRIPHQALLEFYAVTTRLLPGVKTSLLTSSEAHEEI